MPGKKLIQTTNLGSFALNMSFLHKGCARGGHGVVGVHFAKITPNFGFLVAFGGHSWPLLVELVEFLSR